MMRRARSDRTLARRFSLLTCVVLSVIVTACGGGSGAKSVAVSTVTPGTVALASSTSAPTATGVVSPATGAAAASSGVAPGARHIVAIDAGHGGPHNIGAAHKDTRGREDLVEKDLNLDIARRIDRVLREKGYATAMIRDGDYGLSGFDDPDFTASVRGESQARADAVNKTGAEIMLIIHFNGSEDASQSGTEVYFDPDRPFGAQNRALAFSVHDALIAALRALPYDVRDRGVMDDAPIGMRFGQKHTFLLGEAPGFRASTMPAIIVEGLFVTNDREAALLQQDTIRDAIARGYAAGVDAYFAR